MAECQKKKQLLMTECRKYLFTNGSKSKILFMQGLKILNLNCTRFERLKLKLHRVWWYKIAHRVWWYKIAQILMI